MNTPQNRLGPPPDWEVDTLEHSIEVPVLVTIEAASDADVEDIKREAIENLTEALDGIWGFLVDAHPSDCGHGFV